MPTFSCAPTGSLARFGQQVGLACCGGRLCRRQELLHAAAALAPAGSAEQLCQQPGGLHASRTCLSKLGQPLKRQIDTCQQGHVL